MTRERLTPGAEGARVSAVLFAAWSLPVIGCTALAGAPLPAAPLAILGALSLAAGAAASLSARSEPSGAAEATLSELLGWEQESQSCQVKSQPQSVKQVVGNRTVDACIISTQHHSSNVQGTPNPQAPAGSQQQDRPQDGDGPTAQGPGRRPIRPLLELPPRPAYEPTIHLEVAAPEGSPPEPLRAARSTKESRSGLESKPLREAIAELGDTRYIEALDQLLSLSRPGSDEIVLNVVGPLRGLGARGLQNSDGTIGLTRADVLKMRRKARQQVAANLPGDLAMNGEGSSCFSNS